MWPLVLAVSWRAEPCSFFSNFFPGLPWRKNNCTTITQLDACRLRQPCCLFDGMTVTIDWHCANRASYSDLILKWRCVDLASVCFWWRNYFKLVTCFPNKFSWETALVHRSRDDNIFTKYSGNLNLSVGLMMSGHVTLIFSPNLAGKIFVYAHAVVKLGDLPLTAAAVKLRHVL